MVKNQSGKLGARPKPGVERKEALGEALRANLKKRKAQASARAEISPNKKPSDRQSKESQN